MVLKGESGGDASAIPEDRTMHIVESENANGSTLDATLLPRASNISQALKAVSREPVAAEASEIEIRLVETPWEMEAVYRLTHDAYVERGYCDVQPDGRLVHYPHLDGIPQTKVLVALAGGEIVGTNSLTLDGPAGLHMDDDFKAECDAVRAEGRTLAASWRIVTSSTCRSERTVVMGLIQRTVDLMLAQKIQTSVFTFNPRHERVYQRLLNMTTVARKDSIGGLKNAPAVFMRLDMERIPVRWLSGGGA